MEKDILTLGIESSCDETSVAVVKNGREILLKVKDLAVTFYNGKKEFKAVHDVNPLGVGLRCAADGVGVHLVNLGYALAVESEQFRGTVHHRRKLLEYPGVGERFDDDLVSYSIGITLGDANNYFSIVHIVSESVLFNSYPSSFSSTPSL